jgi:ESS family glutamate:Na+ symporter
MGYGQGTGQALNIGNVFASFGFDNGPSFGLAIAAIGFFVACIVGVIYLNVLKKKGKLEIQQQRVEDNRLDTNIYVDDEAPLSESVDKLTIQFGFVMGAYIITYLIILGLSTLATTYLGNFGVKTIKPLLWGFNFLFGSIVAIVAKIVIKELRNKKIMTHTYINSFMMTRLSGLFFDVMIVAGIAAIDWENLKGLLWPLLIICIIGGLGTFLYIKFVAKKIFPDYEHEMFFSMFGMLTGTASTGMILLREIDPNYETPAANNLVLQQVPAIAFGAPLLLLMSFAAESMTNSLIVFGIMIAMFVVYNTIVFRKYIFKKKNK